MEKKINELFWSKKANAVFVTVCSAIIGNTMYNLGVMVGQYHGRHEQNDLWRTLLRRLYERYIKGEEH